MTNQSIPTISHHTALVNFDNFKDDIKSLRSFADIIVKSLSLNVVNEISHSFGPTGKTLVYILSQSHFVLHTWPEYKLIHLDLVSCKKLSEKDFKNALDFAFKNEKNYRIKI